MLAIGCLGSLIFLSISSNDTGNYTCEAVNEELNVGETGSLYDVEVTTSGLLYDLEIKFIVHYYISYKVGCSGLTQDH